MQPVYIGKGRSAEESCEAYCIRFKPVLTLIRYSGLDNEVSTSDPVVDVACPQSIPGKRSGDMCSARLYATERRVKLKVA